MNLTTAQRERLYARRKTAEASRLRGDRAKAHALPEILLPGMDWRAPYNPLRWLDMDYAARLLEYGERGDYPKLQWLFRMVEKRWSVLGALIRRRLAAIGKLDWDIKTVDDSPAAKIQEEELRMRYDEMDGLRAAIEHLCLATFRGFAHVELLREKGGKIILSPVPQWHWKRDGFYGGWRYCETEGAEGAEPPPGRIMVREVDMPVDEIALVAFVRAQLGKKDRDGFIEVFGIPPTFIEMPPDIPEGKQDDYQELAEAIIGDMRGVIPHGAKPHVFGTEARGTDPFAAYLEDLEKEVVLAGTGGLLTMLAEATGLGAGTSNAHDDAFDDLAISEARDISELMQQAVDRAILDEAFPGQPALAYFELAAADSEDLDALAERIGKLKAAGIKPTDIADLSEKFGMDLEFTAAAASPGDQPGAAQPKGGPPAPGDGDAAGAEPEAPEPGEAPEPEDGKAAEPGEAPEPELKPKKKRGNRFHPDTEALIDAALEEGIALDREATAPLRRIAQDLIRRAQEEALEPGDLEAAAQAALADIPGALLASDVSEAARFLGRVAETGFAQGADQFLDDTRK